VIRFRSAFAFLPATLSSPTITVVKAVVFAVALLPLARLVVLTLNDGLGANPIEFLLRSLGTWTLVALLVTLGITPLRRLTGWNWLLRIRRMLGLFTFFYATLHVAVYIGLDQYFDLQAIVADIIKRPYLTFGAVAFVLLIPLAATSFNAAIRWLGARRWQNLHRLVYVIAIAAILHYWYHKLAKNDLQTPAIYGAVLAVLLGARVAQWWNERRRSLTAPARPTPRGEEPAQDVREW
jgi:sulfoxide reductase heme-binding subunit YedZ